MTVGSILFCGAHLDDLELGCGATLLRHKKAGDHIIYVTFSNCQNLERNKTLLTEWKQVVLAVNPDIIISRDLNNTLMPMDENRAEIRHELEFIRDTYDVDTVYTHWDYDINQDHMAVAEETMRVFRYTTVYMYEIPHSCPKFNPDRYVALTEAEVTEIMDICSIYKSQRAVSYYNEDAIRCTLQFRGLQASVPYAQAFKVWRSFE